MIITISGKPGSGKSTVAKAIAEKLGLKHYSMGDLQREIAKEKGITINELGKLEEKSDEIDKKIEGKQIKLGKEESDFIIDSRLGYHFIPDSIKIFLDVDTEESIERIKRHSRKEEKYESEDEAKEQLLRRIESEKTRFKKYYNLDFLNMDNYDLVIDTSNIDKDNVVKKIIEFVSTK